MKIERVYREGMRVAPLLDLHLVRLFHLDALLTRVQ
jgi:hypothetical protein